MTARNLTRNLRILLVLAALPLLASCSTGHVPMATPWPIPTAGSDPTEPPAIGYPMPDLGPSPAPTPFTAVEQESARLANVDAEWQSILSRFPDAVRPEFVFVDYLTGENHFKVLEECYTAAGVGFGRGLDEAGNVGGLSPNTSNEADAIGSFTCQAAHPIAPVAPPSAAMLGYIYDYLTEFVIPCYEGNGITNPPAPSREDFITQWPNQNWFPSMGTIDQNTPTGEAIDQACPILR